MNISLPSRLEDIIYLLASTALPIALLGVGASIKLKKRGEDLKILASIAGLKVILMPMLGWIAFSILGSGGLSLKTGVLMLGMPTAVSTFIYSKELGGDEEFASLNISITTLVSILSISVLLTIFS